MSKATLTEQQLKDLNSLLRDLVPSKCGTISKNELAQLYHINMVTLNKRIMQIDGLYEKLNKKYGYTKWRKYLMPAEVELIMEHLGNISNPLIISNNIKP